MQTTPIYEYKKFKIRGIDKDFNMCECCGKENLKSTVVIENLIDGSIMHFGSTCAYNANKYDSLDAAKEAKKEIQNEIKWHDSLIKECKLFAHRSNVCKEYKKTNNLTPEQAINNSEYIKLFNEQYDLIYKRNMDIKNEYRKVKELKEIQNNCSHSWSPITEKISNFTNEIVGYQKTCCNCKKEVWGSFKKNIESI